MLLPVNSETWLTALLALLLVVLLLRLARNLRRRRARGDDETWHRDTEPFEYWLEIGFDAFAAALVGAAIASPAARSELILLAGLVPLLIRLYRDRKRRTPAPGPPTPLGEILLLVLLYAALVAAALLLIWWTVRPF